MRGGGGTVLARSLVRATPALLRRRPDDAVLFDSWRGRFADSPRALSLELSRREPSLRQTWVLHEDSGDGVPAGTVVVRPRTPEHIAALHRCRLVVANHYLPRYYLKNRATFYLQTWHGTPLKRVGLDVARTGKARRQLTTDAAKWDALLAQNDFAAERFRAAFPFNGEVWTEGYPHNDVLVRPDAEARRVAVRAALGLEPQTRAVLYAPTFRDDALRSGGRPAFTQQLDVKRIQEELGSDVVVLLRVHRYSASTYEAGPHVRDVTTHQDISDLYLAADVLVTDYSSSMFDFAVTGKPIIFFAYDLEHYRDAVRGFYWPLESEAPGPVVRSTDGVIAALENVADVGIQYAEAYGRFRAKYCSLDDGAASTRVVDRLLAQL